MQASLPPAAAPGGRGEPRISARRSGASGSPWQLDYRIAFATPAQNVRGTECSAFASPGKRREKRTPQENPRTNPPHHCGFVQDDLGTSTEPESNSEPEVAESPKSAPPPPPPPAPKVSRSSRRRARRNVQKGTQDSEEDVDRILAELQVTVREGGGGGKAEIGEGGGKGGGEALSGTR